MAKKKRSYTMAEAKSQLGALVEQSQQGPVELTRRGKPVAILISTEEYERRPSLWEAIQDFRKEVDINELPEENLFAERP